MKNGRVGLLLLVEVVVLGAKNNNKNIVVEQVRTFFEKCEGKRDDRVPVRIHQIKDSLTPAYQKAKMKAMPKEHLKPKNRSQLAGG